MISAVKSTSLLKRSRGDGLQLQSWRREDGGEEEERIKSLNHLEKEVEVTGGGWRILYVRRQSCIGGVGDGSEKDI